MLFQVELSSMEATAEHDFSPSAEDELGFRRGQILKVNI